MRRLLEYLQEGVWKRDLRKAGWAARISIGSLRAILHVVSNVERHTLASYAGALTMTTLLAIVPLAATVFSVAEGFGFGETLDRALVEFAAELPSQFHAVVERVRELVDSIDFGKLGLLSSLIVVYTGMSLFNRTERALNAAWETRARRSWLRRFSDFVALVVLVPGLGFGAMTLGSLLQSAKTIESWRDAAPWLGWLYEAGIGFLPYVMIGVALASLYKFMPAARVHWRSALIGGFVAGPALLFMNGLYIRFQFGVSQNNQIYAALAALPLLIVYLQLAWMIVLLGAELAHGVQYTDLLGAGKQVREPSPVLRERVGLALTDRAVRSFESGEGGVDLGSVAAQLDVPRTLIDSVAAELEKGGVLAQSSKDSWMPSRPGDRISVDDVRHAIRGDLPAEVHRRLELESTVERVIASADEAQRLALREVRFGRRSA